MPNPGEWSFVAVHDVLAATVPERDMVVCGKVRRTFGEVAHRTRSIAAFLLERGVGIHTERADLERWESGQDPVALVLHNGTEYFEAMFGAYRARAVPFNVNQHYRPAEIAALLADVGVEAVVYHRRYGPLVDIAIADRRVVLIDVDDGSGVEPLPGSTNFEEAAHTPVTGRVARGLARRSVPRVHRRDDGAPQGGALAPSRHLRLGDGGGRGCHRRVDRRSGHHRDRVGTTVVSGGAADARRRPVDRVLRVESGRHGGGARGQRLRSTHEPSSSWRSGSRSR